MMAVMLDSQLSQAKAHLQGDAQGAASQPGNADAARYVVLRRLAPALKHDMVVNLQATAMMAEVMGARLDRGLSLDADLQKNLTRMNRLTREAVAGCLAVATWIEPADDETVDLAAGVQECVAVLRSNFSFRGFDIAHDEVEPGFPVSRAILRNHLVAAMLYLSDAATAPCEVVISHSCTAAEVSITVRCGNTLDHAGSSPTQLQGLPIKWQDVHAMALEDAVHSVLTSHQIDMRLARMVVTRPLRITPV